MVYKFKKGSIIFISANLLVLLKSKNKYYAYWFNFAIYKFLENSG